MPAAQSTPASGAVVRYSGVYNADGGLVGEARYVVGHLLGMAECALCDITHSPIRRKPEWDRFVARLGVPFSLLHRNELDDDLAAAVRDETLPMVFAHHADGSIVVALSAEQLAQVEGSVQRFEGALRG